MKKKNALLVLLLPLLFSGCATQADIQKMQQANNPFILTKEHFAQTTHIKDGPLDTVVVMDTFNGFRETKGLFGAVPIDSFLRGFINKKTGKKTFQVYVTHVYMSPQWKFYELANYQTPDGPKSVTVDRIASNVIDCYQYSGCMYKEVVGFDVDEGLLRQVAKTYVPGKRNPWLFKLIPKAGGDLEDGITPAEVAGLLDRMDHYTPIK